MLTGLANFKLNGRELYGFSSNPPSGVGYLRFANFCYMTNKEDARFLLSKRGQQTIAKGVVESVESFFDMRNTQTARLGAGGE
mgnify:CR=1 FL=1